MAKNTQKRHNKQPTPTPQTTKNTKNRIFKGLRLKDVIMIMSKRQKRLFLDDLRHDYYKIV